MGKAVGVRLVRYVLTILCKVQGQVGLLATMTLGQGIGIIGGSGLELLEQSRTQGSVAPLPCESHHGGVIPQGHVEAPEPVLAARVD